MYFSSYVHDKNTTNAITTTTTVFTGQLFYIHKNKCSCRVSINQHNDVKFF